MDLDRAVIRAMEGEHLPISPSHKGSVNQTDVWSTLTTSGSVDTCASPGIKDGQGVIQHPLLQGFPHLSLG